MTSIFVAVASHKGISEAEIKERISEKALVAAGHSVTVASLGGQVLMDWARAELTAVALSRATDFVLYLEDKVSVEAKSLLRMIELGSLKEKSEPVYPVVAAPCRVPSSKEDPSFNVLPTSAPDERRMVECRFVEAGCVLVAKEVIEWLSVANVRLLFDSVLVPGRSAPGLFNSIVADAGDVGGTEGHGVYIGDLKAFCHRCRAVQIPLHAYVDAKTNFQGVIGCLGDSIKEQDASARGQGRAPVEAAPKLLGSDGRPLR
jgi:hypothetical protein